jgi:A/G-specific adenine glycosylase
MDSGRETREGAYPRGAEAARKSGAQATDKVAGSVPDSGSLWKPGRSEVAEFRDSIWRFYAEQGRPFPWRETDDEYEILVSELMLQQTQTDRVLKKYRPFLDKFPDYRSLADATTSGLLEMWQGLGYNRRALGLREICRRVREAGGRLPSDRETLLSYPMIGPGTAGSLRAFVFDIPSVFIETNIRRVIIHRFFSERDTVSDREILPVVEAVLDKRDPRHWYYALMDYGVHLKKRLPNPNRRSSHYRRQAPFEGSNRQLRGRILRDLVASPNGADYEELRVRYDVDPAALASCLDGLEQEGFILREAGGSYRIKD